MLQRTDVLEAEIRPRDDCPPRDALTDWPTTCVNSPEFLHPHFDAQTCQRIAINFGATTQQVRWLISGVGRLSHGDSIFSI